MVFSFDCFNIVLDRRLNLVSLFLGWFKLKYFEQNLHFGFSFKQNVMKN